MSEGLFTTHGDEPVEARIVSWVLGEASAFEAAELERLCEERPELMVFKRRMLALHGLLAEAESAKTDDEKWKLPLEKRKAVDEIFGEEKVVRLEVEKEKRIRRSGRRALLAIAACVVLTVVVAGLMAPALIQKARKSSGEHVESGPASAGQDHARYLHEFRKAVRDQEDKVEERSKVLATIERNKDRRQDSPREEAIKRGLDAQDFVDARRELESDKELLQKMKLKLMDDEISDRLSKAELASNTSGRRVQPLRTELPSELIEGTPKPIHVPNLDAPADGPAGSTTWSMAARSRHGREANEPSTKPASPAVPSESKPKVVAANTAPATAVPVPDVEVPTPSLDFGDANDFGASLGGGGGEGAGLAARQPESRASDAKAAEADSFAEDGIALAEAQQRPIDMRMAPSAEVIREFNYPTEYEAPELPNSIAGVTGEADGAAFPKTPATPTAFENATTDASAFSYEGALASRSTARERETKTGSGTLSFNTADELAESIPGGNRSGSGRIEKGNIDGDLRGDVRSAGQKASNAEKQPELADAAPVIGDVPVLGDLFSHDEKSNLSLGSDSSDYYDSNGTLSGTNTYSGGTDLSDGTRGIGGSGGFAASASDAQPAAYGMVDGDSSAGYNFDSTNGAWKREEPSVRFSDKPSEGIWKEAAIDGAIYSSEAGISKDTKSEKREQRLRGTDLAKDKAMIPDDAEALAKEVGKQEDKLEEERLEELATIMPDRSVEYKRQDSFYRQSGVDEDEAMKNDTPEEAIKLGIDAQGNADAKKVFEKDQQLLQLMKLKLMEEIPAAEDPYSTFSLNISDASFQVAQAALAKGEQPDPAGIKVEQFYNAVDYGDPAPGANEPVAVNIEQSAHPVIPGRNLVRIALKTAAAGRSASQPLRLTLLVDQSGSMVREDRRAAMDKALAGLSELLTKNDLVTVIGFSRTPRLLADGMTGDKAGKLAELVNQSASEGGTNLEEAIKLGEQLADRRKLAGAQNRIVLFTDGAANLGNADPDRLAEKVKQLRQKGIAFDIAGIAADGLNDELLGELARNGNGRYYVVGKGADGNFAKQLAGAFRPAAENVKVQVCFNPERVGRYKLIGFEKDRLKTEDFRNDKVDAAELAAEEAGVAIYQVEPLPGGNGELGEVSVRFRDTAAGQMVERTWTIPHDSSAPVLDRATPSMQLAVLAMLAGEKLKGGPLADAIDFKQLTAPAAEVKQFYGNTGRIGEMLRVVDALK